MYGVLCNYVSWYFVSSYLETGEWVMSKAQNDVDGSKFWLSGIKAVRLCFAKSLDATIPPSLVG